MADQNTFDNVASDLFAKQAAEPTFDSIAKDIFPQAPASTGNPWDDAATSLIDEQKQEQRQQYLWSRKFSSDIEPGRQARALQVSKAQGIPLATAYQFLDELEHKPAPDFGKLQQEAPATARLAADPARGPIVFGDEQNIADIEKNLKAFVENKVDLPMQGPPAPTMPLLDQILGPGSTYLTPEQAAAEQKKLIQERAEALKAQAGKTEQARKDILQQMTTTGSSAIDNPPPTSAPANPAVIDQSPAVAQEIRRQSDSFDKLEKAISTPPTMSYGMDLLMSAMGALPKAVLGAREGAGQIVDALSSMLPGNLRGLDEKGLSEGTKNVMRAMDTLNQVIPRDEVRQGDLRTQIPDAILSVVPFLAAGGIARAAGYGATWSAATLGALTQAQQGARDALDNNATVFQKNVAVLVNAIAGTTEAIPVDRLFAAFEEAGGRSFSRFIASMLKNAGTEGAQNVIQQVPPDLWAKLTYDPKRDVLGNAVESFAMGAVAGGFWGGLAAMGNVGPRAEQDKALLEAIGKAATQSSTNKIAPEILEDHIREMKEKGDIPDNVTAPVEAVQKLFQEIGPEEATKQFSDIVRSMEEARRTGAEVQIPVEKIARLANLSGYTSFIDDVRVRPEGMTPREARHTKSELDKFLSEVNTSEQVQDPEQSPVFQNIKAQLVKAGQAAEVAATQAHLFAAFIETQAQRTAKTADDLMRRYGFQVSNQAVSDAKMTKRLGQEADAADKNARGYITFTPVRDKFHVTLTEKANLSTFLHESGHFFLEVVQDIIERGEADKQTAADFQTLRTWMGLKDAAQIGVKEHEQFARGFEAYLMEGKAPSNALHAAFQRFKAWLVFVYKRLANLNVKLSDEVRAVMDRLVASDAAIAKARAQVGWRGKPLSQEDTGLSDAEYKRYTEAYLKAQDAQQQDADARVLLDAARELKDTWKQEKIKVTKELEAELAQTRGYKAWKMLESGEGLQELRPGWSDIKIDPATVPKGFKVDVRGMTAEPSAGGLPLDTVAEIMGFESGEEMLQLIGGAKMAQRAIPARVNQIMMERHGAMDAATLANEALKVVHNKPTMDVLLTEYRALALKANLGVQRGTLQAIQNAANEKVAQLTRRQMDPRRWRRAELQAAIKSAKAAAKGNTLEAAVEKRRQIYAAAMERASQDGIDRIDKIKDYLSTFISDRRRAQLGKAGEMYLDGVDQILEAIEFKNVSLKLLEKRPQLQAIVDAAIAADEPINIPDYVLAPGKKNWTQLSLEQLEGYHDAVKNLWHLAKMKNTLRRKHEKIALDKAMAQAEQTAIAALGTARQPDHLNPTAIDSAISKMRWSRSRLTKMEFLFGWLDGKDDGGLMHQLFYQPLVDARFEEWKMMKDMNERLVEVFKSMSPEQKVKWSTKRNFMGRTLRGENIIAAALNLGNEQNKEKLLLGFGWDEARLMAELSAFMTKEDWDLVQHVWDTIDTLWPHIEKVAKNATGLAPPKVIPSPVATPFGEYRGGYYPVVYDPVLNQRQAENQERNAAQNGLWANNFLRPSLANGFTKARTKYTAPILLSMSVLTKHLTETIHYVTHYEAVTQADKIRSHPTFRRLVTDTMGKEFYDVIRPYLQDIANNAHQRNEPEIGEAIFRHLRLGTTIASMGYNLATAAKQLYGVSTALGVVRPRYWASGIQKAWASPRMLENWRFAMDNSKELAPMVREFDRDVKQLTDTYRKTIGGNVRDIVLSNAFAAIGYVQSVVNVAVWHGAYEEAIARGDSHDVAVVHADSVVRRTQSSGAIKDLAHVQRSGEASKLLTMFYSFGSVVYNQLEDIQKTTGGISDVPRASLRIMSLVVVSALLQQTSAAMWKAAFGDDRKEKDAQPFIVSVLLDAISQISAAVPLGQPVFRFFTGGSPTLSPQVASVEQIAHAGNSLKDWIAKGEAPKRREVRAIVKAVSVLTKTPVSPLYNLIDDMAGGKISSAWR